METLLRLFQPPSKKLFFYSRRRRKLRSKN
jgi:hypothetical protein